jgi:transcription initiation factor TFIIB
VAPDGRILSPGEVYEPEVEQVQQNQDWQEDLNVLFMCPDCREMPPNLVEEFSSGDTVCGCECSPPCYTQHHTDLLCSVR